MCQPPNTSDLRFVVSLYPENMEATCFEEEDVVNYAHTYRRKITLLL